MSDRRQCKLESCRVEFPVPPDAPHKVFCSSAHRDAWHLAQRHKAMALLRRGQGGTRQGPEVVEPLVGDL